MAVKIAVSREYEDEKRHVCETTKWEKRLSRKISAKRRMKRTLILETNFLRLSGKQKKSSLRHSSA